MKSGGWSKIGILALAAVFAFASGCAPLAKKRKKSVVRDCVLPADQSKTFLGNWRVLPIPLALSSTWADADVADIAAAATTWNDFYQESLGIQVFDIGGAGGIRTTNAPAVNLASCTGRPSIINGGQFVGNVNIYPTSNWPADTSADVIAITQRCMEVPAVKPLGKMINGQILVNFRDFFVTKAGAGGAPVQQRIPDLQSILLHELGHLAGLDHSCNSSSASDGVPFCDLNIIPDSYFFAVLFPKIFFVDDLFGEQRRELNENDQGRANCLYEDLAGG